MVVLSVMRSPILSEVVNTSILNAGLLTPLGSSSQLVIDLSPPAQRLRALAQGRPTTRPASVRQDPSVERTRVFPLATMPINAVVNFGGC